MEPTPEGTERVIEIIYRTKENCDIWEYARGCNQHGFTVAKVYREINGINSQIAVNRAIEWCNETGAIVDIEFRRSNYSQVIPDNMLCLFDKNIIKSINTCCCKNKDCVYPHFHSTIKQQYSGNNKW